MSVIANEKPFSGRIDKIIRIETRLGFGYWIIVESTYRHKWRVEIYNTTEQGDYLKHVHCEELPIMKHTHEEARAIAALAVKTGNRIIFG